MKVTPSLYHTILIAIVIVIVILITIVVVIAIELSYTIWVRLFCATIRKAVSISEMLVLDSISAGLYTTEYTESPEEQLRRECKGIYASTGV